MSRHWIAGLLACALALSFTGCGASDRTPEEEGRPYVVSDPQPEPPPFAEESPAANDAPALPGETPQPLSSAAKSETEGEMRGVWISFLEMEHLLTGKSKKQFTANIGQVFDNIRDFGLNTAIVQVRPFADALYDSGCFPWSHVITGTEGQDPGFDPLAIMVEEAQARGLRLEAWINPYRVRAKGNDKPLAPDNQAQKWMDQKSDAVIQYDGAISYNPASAEARKRIVDGVVEIVRNYDVDGVHIDDYFYPSTDAAYDKASYTAYQGEGGKLSLAGWRRSNVETLIQQIYRAVKAENPKVLFGISPQSSVENNYNAQFLDVEKIAGSSGYCDYICPQIYFGYDNDAQPYKKTLDQWAGMVKGSPVRLYVGLAAYKVGAVDSWAGGGKNEWVDQSDCLAKMVLDARACDNYQGFALYRYDSIFRPDASVRKAVEQERKNLRSACGADHQTK